MTENNPNSNDPASTTDKRARQAVTEGEERTLKAEAEEYARQVAEQPDHITDRDRLIELLHLGDSSESVEETLERRVAASTAILRMAHEESEPVAECTGTLIEELRTERNRELPPEAKREHAASETIEDNLVRAIALVIAERPDTAATADDISESARLISTDLDTETVRMVAKAFFTSASELRQPGLVVDVSSELVTYPDGPVQVWSAGALGRLAEETPDAVTSTIDDLRRLLTHDDEAVQHNAVEALGSLVRTRPDAVVPAAEELRQLLDHEVVAIQHNAAGVLGRLAENHPDAVITAAADLQALRDHDDEAVRRVATKALARLIRET